MSIRLIGTDDADPRLPAVVVAATQGTTSADLAPGDIGATTTWTSPFAAGVTVGNGTTTAHYTQVGKHVNAWLTFTLGSTSAITGTVTLTLPVTAHAVGFRGTCSFFDTSANGTYAGFTNDNGLRVVGTAATFGLYNVLSASVPFTWATGDNIHVDLTYLAA